MKKTLTILALLIVCFSFLLPETSGMAKEGKPGTENRGTIDSIDLASQSIKIILPGGCFHYTCPRFSLKVTPLTMIHSGGEKVTLENLSKGQWVNFVYYNEDGVNLAEIITITLNFYEQQQSGTYYAVGYNSLCVSSVYTDTSPRKICFWDWPSNWCLPVADDAHINIPYIHDSANFEDIMPGEWVTFAVDETYTIHTITVINPKYEDSTHE